MVKILVVEDEFLMRERLVKAIDWSSIDCEVIGSAENGKEALEIIERDMPNIVISDIRMPYMDGLELLLYIRENYKTVKVILMTGYSDFVYAQKAIKAGVMDYILKPSGKDEILGSVSKVADIIKEEKKDGKLSRKISRIEVQNDNAVVYLKEQIVDAIEYINRHFADDISLTKVAEIVHVHPVYLGRLLRKELGENFSDIVLRVRIENAKRLLKDVNVKAYEVALNIGINDAHYFSQVFKKHTGMTPTEYRESLYLVARGPVKN